MQVAAGILDPDDDPERMHAWLDLFKANNGEIDADFFAAVYEDLRRLARNCMRSERPWHSLRPTELVNEAYLRMQASRGAKWQDRAHYFRTAAWVMRRILVDYARKRSTGKRGGGLERVPLDNISSQTVFNPDLLMTIDVALGRLAAFDPRLERIVDLRFFAGFTEEEIALLLGLSEKTVRRDWAVAKRFLAAEWKSPQPPSPES